MAKKKKKGLGYKCRCGYWNPCGGGWAAAHWHEELLNTCEGCGNRNVIKNGKFICVEE